MMELVHETHIGVERCLRRARDIMFWPRMGAQLKDYISKCDVCMSLSCGQSKEPIQQHIFEGRPWSKVGADLYDYQERTFLVIIDYHSNFIEVENINRPNWASEASPTLGCSIEISRDIYIYIYIYIVCRYVCRVSN